MIKEQI